MISRRTFMQGAAVALGASTPLIAEAASAGGTAGARLMIDSVETPYSPLTQVAARLRLDGPQLSRFEALRALFAEGRPLSVAAHLDASAGLLLETALHVTGTAVRNVARQDGVLRFDTLPVQGEA